VLSLDCLMAIASLPVQEPKNDTVLLGRTTATATGSGIGGSGSQSHQTPPTVFSFFEFFASCIRECNKSNNNKKSLQLQNGGGRNASVLLDFLLRTTEQVIRHLQMTPVADAEDNSHFNQNGNCSASAFDPDVETVCDDEFPRHCLAAFDVETTSLVDDADDDFHVRMHYWARQMLLPDSSNTTVVAAAVAPCNHCAATHVAFMERYRPTAFMSRYGGGGSRRCHIEPAQVALARLNTGLRLLLNTNGGLADRCPTVFASEAFVQQMDEGEATTNAYKEQMMSWNIDLGAFKPDSDIASYRITSEHFLGYSFPFVLFHFNRCETI
jgi:hypothetical protein